MTAFGVCFVVDVWSLVTHLTVSDARKIMVILIVTFRPTVNLTDSDVNFQNCPLKPRICAFQLSNRLLQNYWLLRMRKQLQKIS